MRRAGDARARVRSPSEQVGTSESHDSHDCVARGVDAAERQGLTGIPDQVAEAVGEVEREQVGE